MHLLQEVSEGLLFGGDFAINVINASAAAFPSL